MPCVNLSQKILSGITTNSDLINTSKNELYNKITIDHGNRISKWMRDSGLKVVK